MAELVPENVIDFSAGQDVSSGVSNVPDRKYYAGVNVSARKGSLGPRWGYRRCSLTFEDGYELDSAGYQRTYREIFEGGKFQAAEFFITGDKLWIVAVIGGFIFLVDLAVNHVTNISIADGSRLNGRLPRINSTVTDKYVIFYDYPDYPVIVSGAAARRADPSKYEVPVSRLGAFNQSRLFVANGGNEFTGGDPVGNTAAIEPPITFEEVLSPGGGAYYQQIFQLPINTNREPVSAMATLQAVDTSTGIGPLIVATTRSIFAYGTHLPRANWEAGQFGSNIVSKVGIAGSKAFVNVNSDMFFISMDGHVRSLSMSQQEQNKWSRVPVSREVDNWIKIHDNDLVKFSAAEYFNNKIFFTVNPFRVEATDFHTRLPISDYAFGGMVVLELDNVSSLGEEAFPAWAGLWTGVRPIQFVNAGDRMFVFSKDQQSVNRLYEIDPTITYDCADDHVRQVQSKVYTKSYSFGNPFNRKRLHSLELNIKDVKGDFVLNVRYKTSHSPYFYDWRLFRHYAPWRINDLIKQSVARYIDGHAFRDFIIGESDSDEESPISDELINVFKEVQLFLELTGIDWEITGFRLKAVEDTTTYNESLQEDYENCILSSNADNDWDYEEFEQCQALVT